MLHRLMCTMASNKMLQLHLKPYSHQLISSSHQLLYSSSNRSRFVAANSTVASNEMMLVIAKQPFNGSLSVLTMSDDNILKQATHIVDDVLLGTHEEHQLEEKVSTFNFSPLLCAIKQLFSEELSLLAHKINFKPLLRKMQTELCRRQIEEDVEAAYWEVEYPNVLGRMIRVWGMNIAFASTTNPNKEAPIPADSRKMFITSIFTGPRTGPKKPNYTFFYGCPDKESEWIKKFPQMAHHVAQDSLVKEQCDSIESYWVGNDNKIEVKQLLLKATNGNQDKVNKFLDLFTNDKRGWVVLSDEKEVLVSDHGEKMLAILERFDGDWKTQVKKIGFGRSFEFSHKAHNHFK